MAIIRFAFVVENEVSHMLELDDTIESPVVKRLINTYRNNTNPTFVETENGAVGNGWTWDGQDFFPPTE